MFELLALNYPENYFAAEVGLKKKSNVSPKRPLRVRQFADGAYQPSKIFSKQSPNGATVERN